MENNIEVKGFYINAAGDPSVGISSSVWTIDGGFFFEDKSDLDGFKGDIELAFGNYCAEKVTVNTFEEQEKLFIQSLEDDVKKNKL